MMISNGTDTMRKKGIALIDSWRADWNRFIRDGFGVRLDHEQQDILASVQHNPRTSVASGTSRGKDFVAACAAISFLYLTPRWRRTPTGEIELFENTKVALTAPTDRQVRNIMIPEISRLYYRAKNRGIALPGKLNAYDIRTDNPEWFLTGFKADEQNHEAWSGFHAVHTMFVVTEASGISDCIFDAIEGNLQGDSRLLIVFNPNTPVGYAARSQKGDRWARFRLNSLTAPNVIEHRNIIPGQVNYEWVKDKLETWCTVISEDEVQPELDDFKFEGVWYRPEDLFRKKVLGCFPKVSDDVLIPQQWLDEAHARWMTAQHNMPYLPEVPMLGVDVAGMGRDATCYVKRSGQYVYFIKTHNSGGTADHMKVAGNIVAALREEPRMLSSIDTIGEGAGVYSRCVELGYDKRTISCKYSEAAKTGEHDLSDITGQNRFANLRAYLFWCVRDWLNPKNGMNAMLPPDSGFDEEATEIRWSFRSDGRIIIEPKEDIKKRLGRSPDRFDALANTFYPLQRHQAIDIERLNRIFGH